MRKRIAKAIKQAVERLKAWSYSRWQDYEKCPAFCKFKHILRIKEPGNAATERGDIVHKLGEQYVRGQLKQFPPEFKLLKAEMKMLREQKATVEQEWAFDVNWQPVSWFDAQAWVRIKVDAHYLVIVQVKKAKGVVATTVVIVDYKTGKNKPEHAKQRSLYGLGGFAMYPDAVEVIAQHWYTDTGEIESETFNVKDLATMRKQWEQRTRALLADETFAPRPSAMACKYCFYQKAKGGPCQY